MLRPTVCWPNSRTSAAASPKQAAKPPAIPHGALELLGFEREVAQAREEADRNDRRTRDLDLLVRLWDVRERKTTAEQRLASWEEPTPLAAWLETRATELQSLRSACSGHLERVGQLADLCNQRDGIEQSIKAAMGALGPGWDRDRVRTSDGWIGLIDEARRFRVSLGELEASRRTAAALAEDADAAPELARLPDPDGAAATVAPAATQAEPELQARLVSELRRNLAELRLLNAQQQASGRRAGASAGALWSASGVSMALAAFAIVGLSIVAALATGVSLRIACVVLAAAGCALLAVAVGARHRLLATAPKDETGARATSERVVVRVGELATALGLPETPSDSDVETAAEAVEAARALERSLEDDRRRTTAALQRHAAAHESLERASGRLEAERAGFAAWKVAHGLAPALSPEGVLESLTALQAAWKDLGALDRVDAKIDQLRGEVSLFDSRLGRLWDGFRDLGGHGKSLEADPAGALDELCASVEEVVEHRATRASLMQVVEEADAELERSFGLGHRAKRLWAELETGEVLAWTEEQAALVPARHGCPSPSRAAGASAPGRVERAARCRRLGPGGRARADTARARAGSRRRAPVLGRSRMCPAAPRKDLAPT